MRKVKGEGLAKSCEGFLSIEASEPNVKDRPTVWSHQAARRYDIGGVMYLALFHVTNAYLPPGDNTEILGFLYANLERGYTLNNVEIAYSVYANSILTIELHAESGQVPEPLKATIADIISQAQVENSLNEFGTISFPSTSVLS